MSLRGELIGCLGYLSGNVLLERLFWASVEMALIALAVWGLIAAFRPGSPRVRALLWLLVLAKPLTALAVGPLYPVFRLETPEVRYANVDLLSRDEGAVALTRMDTRDRRVAAPAGSETVSGGAPSWFGSIWAVALRMDLRWGTVSLWFGLALLIAAYKGTDGVRLRRIIKRGVRPPETVLDQCAAAARDLGVKRAPRLVVTASVESPALAGVLRPVILLPAWMVDGAERDAIDWALRHELAHWKLGDTLANLLRQVSHVFFFFHPMTWWAGARWEESAELACDRALVNSQGEVDAYAGTLYQVLAQIHGRRQRGLAGGLCATRTQIGRRIAALLGNPLRYPARLGASAAVGLIMMAAGTLAIGGAFNEDVVAETQTPPPVAAAGGSVDEQIRKVIDELSTTAETEVDRVNAVFALVKAQPNAEALKALIPWLANDEPTKRRSAIYIIQMLEWADASPAFEALRGLLVAGQETLTRGMAAMALASQGDAVSYDTILELARNDGDPYVRRCAAWALGEFGDGKALEPLQEIAKNKEPFVAANAANATERLTFLSEHQEATGDAAQVVQALFIVSGSTLQHQERLRRAQSLASSADPAIREAVFTAAKEGSSQAIKNSVAYLIHALETAGKEPDQAAKDNGQAGTVKSFTEALDESPADALKNETKPTVEQDTKNVALVQVLESPVSIEFDDIHLSEIVQFIAESYDLDVMLDWRVVAPPPSDKKGSEAGRAYATDGMVPYLDLSDVPLRVALEAMLRPLGLMYRAEHGVIWISTKQQMEKDAGPVAHPLPPPPDTMPKGLEALESPVSLEFENIHLHEIAAFISDSYDLNIVIDSRVVPPPGRALNQPPDGSAGYVTDGMLRYVNLTEVPLKYCLEFVLRPLNLVWAPAEGYIWITAVIDPPANLRGSAGTTESAATESADPATREEASLALLRISTLESGVERAQIRTPGGAVRWYNEGESFEEYTLLEIRGNEASARIRLDKDGSEITLHSALDRHAPGPAWSGPYLQFRWEAREGGSEPVDEVSWIVRERSTEPPLRLERAVLVDETDIRSASMREREQARGYDVAITLSDEAAKRFGEATTANVGRRLAIVFDGEILSAPVVRSRVDQNVMVSGLDWKWADAVLEAIQMAPKREDTATLPARSEVEPVTLVQAADTEAEGPQYSVDAKFIHVPEMGLPSILPTLEQMTETVVSPSDVLVYRISDPEDVLGRIGEIAGHALISGPRVTFRVGSEHPKLLIRKSDAPEKLQDTVFDMIQGYSPSLDSFWNEVKPVAIFADLTTEYFRNSRGAEPQQIHYGVALAIGAVTTDTPDRLDLDLYLNNTRLHHPSRGLVFWRSKPAPEVIEHPVRVHVPLRAGDAIGIASRSNEPGVTQFVLVTLSAVVEERQRFVEL